MLKRFLCTGLASHRCCSCAKLVCSQIRVIREEIKDIPTLMPWRVLSFLHRIFILHCDMAEFKQHIDEQDCCLTLCARKPNAEWLICFHSCDRQVAGSFYSQIMRDLIEAVELQWRCTQNQCLSSHVLSPPNCSFCFWYLFFFLNIFTSPNPLWSLVFSELQWKTLSDKVANANMII